MDRSISLETVASNPSCLFAECLLWTCSEALRFPMMPIWTLLPTELTSVNAIPSSQPSRFKSPDAAKTSICLLSLVPSFARPAHFLSLSPLSLLSFSFPFCSSQQHVCFLLFHVSSTTLLFITDLVVVVSKFMSLKWVSSFYPTRRNYGGEEPSTQNPRCSYCSQLLLSPTPGTAGSCIKRPHKARPWLSGSI